MCNTLSKRHKYFENLKKKKVEVIKSYVCAETSNTVIELPQRQIPFSVMRKQKV